MAMQSLNKRSLCNKKNKMLNQKSSKLKDRRLR